MSSDSEYSKIAQDHARDPRNGGRPESWNGHACITGPCGDTMEFWVRVVDGKVQQANFVTDGCGASMACGSMTTELAIGRTLEGARDIGQKDVLDALGAFPPDAHHCALLSANTLQAACDDYAQRREAASRSAAGSGSCSGCTSSSCDAKTKREEESEADFASRQMLGQRMCAIGHKILVLSGKGGVGKSTVAANLAVALARGGARVGLLDVDVHGPSLPGMLGLDGSRVMGSEEGIIPIERSANLSVMSVGFLVQSEDAPVIWRGPMKFNIIRQLLADVLWGSLDYLVVDAPPGTGDEPLAVAQLIGQGAGAVVVTTPQTVAINDVRRCVSFCRSVSVPVVGIVENMSGMSCPTCGTHIDLFKTGGGARLAEDMGVPFLGAVPIDPQVVSGGDGGVSMDEDPTDGPAKRAFAAIVTEIASALPARSLVAGAAHTNEGDET